MQLEYTKRNIPRFLKTQITDCGFDIRRLPAYARGWMKGYSTRQIRYWQPDRRNPPVPNELNKYRVSVGTNRGVWPFLHDKLLFDVYMRDRLPIIPMLAVLIEGRASLIGGMNGKIDWRTQLEQGQSLVIKPLRGGGGRGIMFVSKGKTGYSINSVSCDRVALDAALETCAWHGIYPYVNQHPDVAAFYPATTNTLRIISCKAADSRSVLACARLRVGTSVSAPTDNFERGGLAARIDLRDGRITAAMHQDKGNVHPVERHPETGAKIVGAVIPFWTDIVSTLNAFIEANDAFDFVGWDVLVAPDRFHIIEANHNPGLMSVFIFRNEAEEEVVNGFFRERKLG